MRKQLLELSFTIDVFKNLVFFSQSNDNTSDYMYNAVGRHAVALIKKKKCNAGFIIVPLQ